MVGPETWLTASAKHQLILAFMPDDSPLPQIPIEGDAHEDCDLYDVRGSCNRILMSALSAVSKFAINGPEGREAPVTANRRKGEYRPLG
jgi:hypothetical protein